MTADQADNGINALNRMMHGWLLDGIDIGHIDLDLADVFTMEPQFEEGASTFSPNGFPRLRSPGQLQHFRFQEAAGSAAYLIIPDIKFDRTMTRRRSFWNDLGSSSRANPPGTPTTPLATLRG